MTSLIGFNSNFGKQVSFGVAGGILFIILNLLNPSIAIGIPLQFAFSKEITIGFLAPVWEEAIFRGVIPALVPFGDFVSPIAFSLFHYVAYGASLQAQNASFIGALLFGVVALLVTKFSKSLLPAMIMHSIFNLWLGLKFVVALPV